MLFIHLKSIGHSLKKHGAQGAAPKIKRCFLSPGIPGPVSSGEVLPNGTTTGVPTAAATCIGPVSLVRTTRQNFNPTHNSRSEVFPARLITDFLSGSFCCKAFSISRV